MSTFNIVSKRFLLIFFLLYSFAVNAQSDSLKIDSLKKVLLTEKEDTNKVNRLNELSSISRKNSLNEISIQYAKEAVLLAKKFAYKKGQALAYYNIGIGNNFINNIPESFKNLFSSLEIYQKLDDKLYIFQCYKIIGDNYYQQGNFPEALKNSYMALKLAEELKDKDQTAELLARLGFIYSDQGNFPEALKSLMPSLKIYKEIKSKYGIANSSLCIGEVYNNMGNYYEALRNDSEALRIFKEVKSNHGIGFSYLNIGKALVKQGEAISKTGDKALSNNIFYQAFENYSASVKLFEEDKAYDGLVTVYLNLGNLSIQLKNYPEGRNYLKKCLELAQTLQAKPEIRDSYKGLANLDSVQGNFTQAYEHYKMYILYRDSLVNEESTKKSMQVKMQYEFDKKEAVAKAEQAKKDAESKRIRNQQYFTIAALGIVVLAVVIIALIQFKSNKHKQKANLLLQNEKQKVETTLEELKSTQAQLIQSEKMASLGELTAGIAHEIQNPLNFVNNFSEVNKEMIDEATEEIDKGNITEVKNILNDIKDNEEKINHHGKRADAIVKGMLQHSRQTKGIKEPTDINALCDEYLRLSYHGLRAKDKSFNADFKTDFDESIGKINIVPQDIGRVLLNLFNNAFYAVNEKQKAENLMQKGASNSYVSLVTIVTQKINNNTEIKVSDNGNGIPQNIIDKIFQPFFTTKPTGQGTGLGLSLAYDIITKEHNGTIKVESKEGEGSEFIIQLPILA